MFIFMLVGVCGSFVAIAMLIAVLKCCVESLTDDSDNHQKFGKINTYKSRHGNTYMPNTNDTDDLTEVWTTNDNNGTDPQWSCNIDDGGNEGDLRLADGCDSTTGVGNDSKPDADHNTKHEGGDSTLGGEDKAISGVEVHGPGHDATFSTESHSVHGQSDHNSILGGGSHSTFGGESHSPFGGGSHSAFGADSHSTFGGGSHSAFGHHDAYDNGHGGHYDTGYGGGYDSGYGVNSGGGGGDYGGDGGGC